MCFLKVLRDEKTKKTISFDNLSFFLASRALLEELLFIETWAHAVCIAGLVASQQWKTEKSFNNRVANSLFL